MRTKINTLKNQNGATRVIEKFLWFPKILEDELRWLEKVKIIQKVCEIDVDGSMEWGKYKYKWVDMKWKD